MALITQLNSKQMMDVLDDARTRVNKLEDTAAVIKLNLDSRLSVLRNVQEYQQSLIRDLQEKIDGGVESTETTRTTHRTVITDFEDPSQYDFSELRAACNTAEESEEQFIKGLATKIWAYEERLNVLIGNDTTSTLAAAQIQTQLRDMKRRLSDYNAAYSSTDITIDTDTALSSGTTINTTTSLITTLVNKLAYNYEQDKEEDELTTTTRTQSMIISEYGIGQWEPNNNPAVLRTLDEDSTPRIVHQLIDSSVTKHTPLLIDTPQTILEYIVDTYMTFYDEEKYDLPSVETTIQTTTNTVNKYVNTHKIVFASANIVDGRYETFGGSIHPALLKVPSDVFNYQTVSGYVYKDNAAILMNGVQKPKYRSALMRDSIQGQDLCFEEFNTASVRVDITINPGALLGNTQFNTIEIVPFLPGSFNISNLLIYSMQDFQAGNTNATESIEEVLENVDCIRILLNDKINLYRFVMDVELKFKNGNNKYPFGLKHIYFFNADYDVDSFVVVKVDQAKTLRSISEDITVSDQTSSSYKTSCVEEDIVLYETYSNGIGRGEITTSKGLSENRIPHSIRSFFLYYPIKRSTISLTFDSINLNTSS